MAEKPDEPRKAPLGDEVGGATPFPSEPGDLQPREIESLWELFQQIGRVWTNVRNDSAGQRSSWLEFVHLRSGTKPSYLEEYRNALRVVDELTQTHGLVEGYSRLLLHRVPTDPAGKLILNTGLDHAKVFVVDEFIRVQVVAGGFRGFGSEGNRRKTRPKNYNGYLKGSRYAGRPQGRVYRPNGGRG